MRHKAFAFVLRDFRGIAQIPFARIRTVSAPVVGAASAPVVIQVLPRHLTTRLNGTKRFTVVMGDPLQEC